MNPLAPLTADEISLAVAIVRKTPALADDALMGRERVAALPGGGDVNAAR